MQQRDTSPMPSYPQSEGQMSGLIASCQAGTQRDKSSTRRTVSRARNPSVVD